MWRRWFLISKLQLKLFLKRLFKLKSKTSSKCKLCLDEKFIEDKTCPDDEGGYRIEPCPKCNPKGDGN